MREAKHVRKAKQYRFVILMIMKTVLASDEIQTAEPRSHAWFQEIASRCCMVQWVHISKYVRVRPHFIPIKKQRTQHTNASIFRIYLLLLMIDEYWRNYQKQAHGVKWCKRADIDTYCARHGEDSTHAVTVDEQHPAAGRLDPRHLVWTIWLHNDLFEFPTNKKKNKQ